MCSNRCAKPVRPGFSFFEPTWNHWFTCTIGSLRSTCRMTCRPLGSVYFSNSSFGMAAWPVRGSGPARPGPSATRASTTTSSLRKVLIAVLIPEIGEWDVAAPGMCFGGRGGVPTFGLRRSSSTACRSAAAPARIGLRMIPCGDELVGFPGGAAFPGPVESKACPDSAAFVLSLTHRSSIFPGRPPPNRRPSRSPETLPCPAPGFARTSSFSPTTCSKDGKPALAATTWPRATSPSALKAAGYAPGADDGTYFQQVPFIESTPDGLVDAAHHQRRRRPTCPCPTKAWSGRAPGSRPPRSPRRSCLPGSA